MALNEEKIEKILERREKKEFKVKREKEELEYLEEEYNDLPVEILNKLYGGK